MPEVEQVLDLIERKYDSQVFCHKLVPDTINFEMVKALASVASVLNQNLSLRRRRLPRV